MAKKVDIMRALNEYEKILALQDRKGSTGSLGKWVEVITRRYLNRKGELASITDVHARECGRADARNVDLGNVEIKVNSGAVCYGDNLSADDCIAENVLSNADSVVWYPDIKVSRDTDPLIIFRLGFVFSREQFIVALETMGKHGIKSMLKTSKNGSQINIQTINPVPFGKLLDFIESNNIPTVLEWGESRNRKWK